MIAEGWEEVGRACDQVGQHSPAAGTVHWSHVEKYLGIGHPVESQLEEEGRADYLEAEDCGWYELEVAEEEWRPSGKAESRDGGSSCRSH